MLLKSQNEHRDPGTRANRIADGATTCKIVGVRELALENRVRVY